MMKKFLLAGMASAIAFIPAAHAAPAAPDFSIESAADYKRGEGRRGDRVRGQGQVSQGDGQGERAWRGQRQAQDAPRNERRAERRGGWNQQQGQTQGTVQGQTQGRTWNRGEERRDRDDDYRRRRDGDWNRGGDWNRNGNRDDDRRWNGRSDNDRRYDGRWEGRRDDDRRYSDNRRYDSRERWNRDWRSDRRYDWRGHRERYRSYYRPGRYYAPYRDYRYRRFSIGIHIGSPFYSNRYWIADPWYYRLPPAYGPYRWVRYYDDVLLVDIRNGYVVDVIHNFFW